MMAWPVKSDEGTASICEVVVCRKSYSTAPRPVRATSSSDNPSRLLFINNLESRLSITRSFGNRTVFGHVGARMSLRLLKITFVAMAVFAPAPTLPPATPPHAHSPPPPPAPHPSPTTPTTPQHPHTPFSPD